MVERKQNTGRAAGAPMSSTRCPWSWVVAVLLLVAFWLGSVIPLRTVHTGELQQSGSNEPFLAGDERSIPVLKDILATVKQIDARLERIEKQMPAERKP